MRAAAPLFAVLVALALAGCSGGNGTLEPNSPVDPEEAEASDYVVPAIIFAIVSVLGLGLLVLLLGVRRRRRRKADAGARPPSGPGPKGP